MERRTFTFEQQSTQLDFIEQENEFLIWYDTIIIINVDQKLSDLFQGTHSQTFNKVKKSLWPSPLLKLKACFFRQVDVVPPQPVAAKVTVLYVAVHLNLRSVLLSSVRARTSVNLVGKRGSRRRSTTSFRANVVVAKTRYQMVKVLLFCHRKSA